MCLHVHWCKSKGGSSSVGEVAKLLGRIRLVGQVASFPGSVSGASSSFGRFLKYCCMREISIGSWCAKAKALLAKQVSDMTLQEREHMVMASMHSMLHGARLLLLRAHSAEERPLLIRKQAPCDPKPAPTEHTRSHHKVTGHLSKHQIMPLTHRPSKERPLHSKASRAPFIGHHSQLQVLLMAPVIVPSRPAAVVTACGSEDACRRHLHRVGIARVPSCLLRRTDEEHPTWKLKLTPGVTARSLRSCWCMNVVAGDHRKIE